jgi:hypothetical protein
MADRRGAAAAAGALAVAGLAWAASWTWYERVVPGRERVAELEADLDEERRALGRQGALEAERAALLARRAELDAKIPRAAETDMEAFRRALTDYATDAGVLLTAIRPSAAAPPAPGAPPGQLEAVAFGLEARGSFSALGRFLHALESQARLITIEELEMRPRAGWEGEAEEGAPRPVPVVMTLRMTAYQMR